MQTTAVRLYGANDLRLESFELPPIRDDEMLGHIISDSICMSSYKAAVQGESHKRVPADIARHPIIIGHEFCGEILEVGAMWRGQYHPGQRFAIQPALKDPYGPVGEYSAPGYSYPYFGGAATHIIIPNAVMARGCLLPYTGDAYFKGSLAEPMSCIIGPCMRITTPRPARIRMTWIFKKEAHVPFWPAPARWVWGPSIISSTATGGRSCSW
jgi:threonine dehydrogenase-like Zn-dependent dehydrogenase